MGEGDTARHNGARHLNGDRVGTGGDRVGKPWTERPECSASSC